MQDDDGVRGWSGELKAENRRFGGGPSSRWLKDDSDGGESGREGENHRHVMGMHSRKRVTVELMVSRPYRQLSFNL